MDSILPLSHQNIKNKIQSINYISKDPYILFTKINSFISFKSVNDILYLIYSTKNISIISYNLINAQKINEIKNAHKKCITNFRHYLDNYNKRDLVISVSLEDNNIKLWNVNNYDCLANIKNANKKGGLLSACFLKDNNKIYIISSNQSSNQIEPIKIFNLEGNVVKKVNNSNYSVFYIDVYYDIKNSKTYILSCNNACIRSYDYINNKLYNIYSENFKINTIAHIYLIINNKEEMIELCEDGKIRIWNFHSAKLLHIVQVGGFYKIKCFCVLDEEYIFVGCADKEIKFVQIKDGKIIENYKGHNMEVNNINIVNHPKYGKILISQGWKNDGIRIWKINN